MKHNPPYIEGLYQQRISTIELDVSLRDFKKTHTILNPKYPHKRA
jgi:hypothetical protein